MLVSRYGPSFIDRIEAEADRSPAFRECLGLVHPDPVFPIPESLWERLTAAAERPIGPMAPHMAELYTAMPDLAEALSWDPEPLDPGDAPTMGPEELLAQAQAWIAYEESFWAWEELHEILERDGCEPTWPIILALIETGSDRALGPIGAGILEALLGQHGPDVIERIEAQVTADPRFRFCLSHAWQGDMSDEIWARVVAARGDEPQRG